MTDDTSDTHSDIQDGEIGEMEELPEYQPSTTIDKLSIELMNARKRPIPVQDCEGYTPEEVTRRWDLGSNTYRPIKFGPPGLGFPHRMFVLPGAFEEDTILRIRQYVLTIADPARRYIITQITSEFAATGEVAPLVGEIILKLDFRSCGNFVDLKNKDLAIYWLDESTVNDPQGLQLLSKQDNQRGKVTALLDHLSGYVVGSGRTEVNP